MRPETFGNAMARPVTAPGVPPAGRSELIGIQYARAVAAIMVVVHHLHVQLDRMGYVGFWPDGLAGGVDVFFVISGLIMWVTTCDRPMSPLTFMRRRVTRIAPLYWIVTSVTVALMLAVPGALQSAVFDLRHVLASYAFVAWQHPTSGMIQPVVIPGWTLNYEMFFYLIFAAALFLKRRARFWAVIAALALLVLAGTLASVTDRDIAGFYTAPILLEFAFGMALGEVFVRTHRLEALGRSGAAALMIVGIALVFAGPILAPQAPRVIVSGIPALIFVTGVLACDAGGWTRTHALPLALGNASYSLYLLHPMLLSAAGQVWRKLGLAALPLGLPAFALAATVGCCIGALLCFRYVEAPMVRLFRERRA